MTDYLWLGRAENLANRIKAMTLFATHYFELTTLPEKLEGTAKHSLRCR